MRAGKSINEFFGFFGEVEEVQKVISDIGSSKFREGNQFGNKFHVAERSSKFLEGNQFGNKFHVAEI